MKALLLLITALLVATNWVIADEEPNLDDPKVREKILKEAVLDESLELRGRVGKKLHYQADKQTPYTGWRKVIHENEQVASLVYIKDGKREGLFTMWHENGEKRMEGHLKDWKQDGLWTEWDEDGKVVKQTRFKDGVEVKE